MIKRPLGKTGMQVSEVAFGGVEIGMPYGFGAESAAGMISEADAIYLLHSAVDSGINFFDTARLYGQSEFIMGKAFKDRRNDIILETKCRQLINDDGAIPPYSTLNELIEASLSESLEALQTDYIDVFMLHQGNMKILENEEISQIFSNLKASGRIRATGVSTYTPRETEEAIKTGMWDVIQLPFNLMDQRQHKLFPLALQEGVGIIIRSVLLRGLLSHRGKNLHPALQGIEEHIEQYHELIGDSLPDLPTLATKFALSFDEVSSILVGIDRMEYLYKALEAANGNYLDTKNINKAKALAYPDPDFLNLHNWNKKGWLK
jgi:aryl-alcohol dehydrogenase-like predicted oxidoreductase